MIDSRSAEKLYVSADDSKHNYGHYDGTTNHKLYSLFTPYRKLNI